MSVQLIVACAKKCFCGTNLIPVGQQGYRLPVLTAGNNDLRHQQVQRNHQHCHGAHDGNQQLFDVPGFFLIKMHCSSSSL